MKERIRKLGSEGKDYVEVNLELDCKKKTIWMGTKTLGRLLRRILGALGGGGCWGQQEAGGESLTRSSER